MKKSVYNVVKRIISIKLYSIGKNTRITISDGIYASSEYIL